jgi:hypothetical protein
MLFDDDTATTTACGEDDSRILKQALDYLDSESLEKARQKHSMLSCLRVRDEISSLKGQVESILRRYNHAKKRSQEADALMEKVDVIEALMRDREECLNCLQKEEANRQLEVIAERAAIRRAGAVADSLLKQQQQQQQLTAKPPSNDVLMSTPVRKRQESPYGVVAFASPARSPAEAMLAIASQAVLVCIDCSITPTTHKCRRCRRYVCDLCCSTQRGLEMIWWCAACFDDESVSNQKMIRDGRYESDGDE